MATRRLPPVLPPELRRRDNEPAPAYLGRLSEGLCDALDLADRLTRAIALTAAETLPPETGLRGAARLRWWVDHAMSRSRGYSIDDLATQTDIALHALKKFAKTGDDEGWLRRDTGPDGWRQYHYHPDYQPGGDPAEAEARVLAWLAASPSWHNPAAVARGVGHGHNRFTMRVLLDALADRGLVDRELYEGDYDYSTRSTPESLAPSDPMP